MTNNDTIDAQLLDLMLRAGSRWVLWLLLLLSLAAVAVMIDRIWFFLQERPPRDRLAAAMRAMRDGSAATALAKLAGARSMESPWCGPASSTPVTAPTRPGTTRPPRSRPSDCATRSGSRSSARSA
jgi:hypothetical protein